jgi:hypothetical protein
MNFIFTTTAETKCNFAELAKNTTSGKTQGYMTLFCSYGTMQTISDFGLSVRSGASTCPSDQYGELSLNSSCTINSMGQNYRDIVQSIFNRQCLNKASCTMTIDRVMFNSNCSLELDERLALGVGPATVYMQALC